MNLARRPIARLRPFVTRVWASDVASQHHSPAALAAPVDSIRRVDSAGGAIGERMLPTGAMHLVLRLDSDSLEIHGPEEPRGQRFGPAIVGGARSGPYFKIARPVATVGAMLAPGASAALFGVPADELSLRHTPLDGLWGADAERLCDELAGLDSLEQRVSRFEHRLMERLPPVRGLHPGVAVALDPHLEPEDPTDWKRSMSGSGSVEGAAYRAGLSHRRFGQLVREAVGLSPKKWLRLVRFQRAVAWAASDPLVPWSEVALALGYSDQSHFNREFREFSGLTPGEYRRLAPSSPNHVPYERVPVSSRRGRRSC